MYRIRISAVAAVVAIASFTACGSDKGTGPAPLGKPVVTQVNGVTEPVGLIGMTVMIEGASLGDLARGKVYFLGTGGARIQATVANVDWTDAFIVTTVPQGTADSSKVWVETTGGVSDSISFTLISSGLFSPSNITWSTASALPQPLQGLGAVAVRIGRGSTKGSWVYTVGGADPANVSGKAVYRAPVMADGGLGPWSAMTSEPTARAYHAVVAATPSTARVDTTVAAYVYAIGGIDATGATIGTVEFTRVGLDGELTAWQSTTPLPAALHNAGAVVFRGFVYVSGGASGTRQPTTSVYRAQVHADGTLGAWQSVAALPMPTAYHSMVSFGPYVYVVGGDNGIAVAPTDATLSGDETNAAYVGRIDMRNGTLPAWAPVTGMGKARSKGAVVAAGGSLLVSSGIYAGQAGSSENTYASISADGSLASWNGATGSNTIDVLLGYAVYNTATVFFLDAQGRGHVMLLGGANRSTTTPGQPSAAVVYY
jgi:hypothetical protein